MRVTVDIDDDLLQRAQALSGIKEPTALVHEALKALIERESARQLAQLGGSEPQLDETLDWLRRKVWSLPELDQRSDDEILGYNEEGHFD